MTFTKPITETMQNRVSCRTYLKEPIKEEARELLARFTSSMQVGPFGARARFALVSTTEGDGKALRGLGTYGFIKGATGFLIGAMGADDRALEDYGYLMEQIVLYATELGLGTCWLGGTFTKSSFARKIKATAAETVPAVISVGHCAQNPGARDAMIARSAGARKRLPWEKLFYQAGFGLPLSQEQAGDYAPALEMVRIGPSASNKQPWRIVRKGSAWHFFMQRTPGYRRERLTRLVRIADMQRLDMGIAMCHFELSARELGLQGAWADAKPDLAMPDDLTEYTTTWLSA